MSNTISQPQLVLFEDDHLLAIHKPAGIASHSLSPFDSDGLLDWLRNRRREWKEIRPKNHLGRDQSGILLFSKTPTAYRHLNQHFARKSPASHSKLECVHPVTNQPLAFEIKSRIEEDASIALRQMLWPEQETNAWRLIHGASDSEPGWYVDRLGDFLLSQSESPLSQRQTEQLSDWQEKLGCLGTYHKILDRQVRKSQPETASPQWVQGQRAPERFEIRENGIQYSLSFDEGYSVGLFLDQKDNRRRLLDGYVGPGFQMGKANTVRPLEGLQVLNTFAYTCAFSVCAAKSGATVTSLDLSRKYLDWGRDNFRLNQIDPETHDFIYGDCFDWMKRLAKKGRRYDLVLLDPPTFSKAKKGRTFKADKDYGQLVELALELLNPNGTLFCSTNCASFHPEAFLTTVRSAISGSNRIIQKEQFVPQPPDFPTSNQEPPYLKTVWIQLTGTVPS